MWPRHLVPAPKARRAMSVFAILIFRDGCPGGETPGQVGARVDRVIARTRAVEGDVALFAHGHVLRVLAARWLGLPAGAGQPFLLDTGTLNVLDDYHGIPAVRTWNAPLTGYASPITERGSQAIRTPTTARRPVRTTP
jgi:broad specificity phosphatase PhoE